MSSFDILECVNVGGLQYVCVCTFLSLVVCYCQVSLVYGQMNEPPGTQARVALGGLCTFLYVLEKSLQYDSLFCLNTQT